MSSVVDIAIVGGYGDVGFAAARSWLALHARDRTPTAIRLGGRDPAVARDCAERLGKDFADSAIYSAIRIESTPVDLFDPNGLDTFVAGARIVLNCAGPSHRIGDRVAAAALRAGSDYVDAAGDDALYHRLDDPHYVRMQRRALISAGMQPGVSALLTRWAARDMDAPLRLESYIGVRDRFTLAAADDFLQGGVDGSSEPLAAWRNGPRKRVLQRTDTRSLPGFGDAVTLLPYLNTEGERVARALGVDHGDWYNAVEHGHVLDVFEQAHGSSRCEAVARLTRASELDLAGRRPQVTMLIQIESRRGIRTVQLRAAGNAALSGAFAATACQAVARGDVEFGRHFAGLVLDPGEAIETLRATAAIDALITNDAPIARFNEVEEDAV